jgi:hypothetical protein
MLLPGPDDAADADDLSGRECERRVDHARAGDVPRGECRGTGAGARPDLDVRQFTTGDHAHQLIVVHGPGRRVSDQPSVAQDGDPVGQVEHLVEPVRDEDDACPFARYAPDRGEQA